MAIATLSGPDFVIEAANESFLSLVGAVLHQSWRDGISSPALAYALTRCLETGASVNDVFSTPDQPDKRCHVMAERLDTANGYRVSVVMQLKATGYDLSCFVSDNEARYAMTVEASELGIWDYDLRTGAFTAAGKMATIWGYDTNEEMTIGHLFRKIHPADLAEQERILAEIHKSRIDQNFEIAYRLIGEDGSTRWIRAIGKAFVDHEGQIYRTVGTVADITAQRETEEILKYKNTLLETVTDNTSLALFMMDRNQHCIYMNHAAERMTGYRQRDLEGRKLHYFIHHTYPDGRPFPLEECAIDQALPAHRRTAGEEVFIHRDGTFFPVSFTASPIIIDGEGIGTVLEVRETTDEKRREQELRETSERFELINRATQDAVWDWIVPTGELKWNEAASVMFGVPIVDIPQTLEWWEQQVHPDDVDAVVNDLKAVLEGSGDCWSYEYRVVCHDGSVKHVLDRGFVIRDPLGKALRMLGSMQDITERKTYAARLQEKENRFRSTFENAATGIAQVSGEGRWLFVNGRITAMLGYTKSELKELTFQDVTHPNDIDKLATKISGLLAAGQQHFTAETRLLHKKGHEVCVNLSVSAIQSDDAIPRQLVFVMEDISERKRAQEALKAAQAQNDATLAALESLLQNAPIGFAFFDAGYRYVRINDVLADINGIPVGQHLGRSIPELLPYMMSVCPIIDNIFKTGDPLMNCEITGETPKLPGVKRVFLTGFYPVHQKGTQTVEYVGCVVAEITDRKMAEERSLESESRFRVLADTLPQMIWTLTPDGHPEYASAQYLKYSGIAHPREAWTYMIHPDDREQAEAGFAESMKNGTEFHNEIRLRNKDGEYRYHHSMAIPVKDHEGRILKWVGAMTDIHERISFAEELKRQVDEKTSDLRHLNTILEQKNIDLQVAETFLETVLNSSVEMVISYDHELRYTYINKRGEEFLRKKRAAIMGQRLFDVSPQLENTEFHQALLRALSGERVHISKREIAARPGTFVESYMMPIKSGNSITGVVSLSRDITEIIQLTDQLQRMVHELQRSNEDLQQFAHVASHDLKEPVRKSMTFGSRLKEEFQHLLPERAMMYLNKMEAASARMYDMIDGVLKYSSLTASDHHIEAVDLQDLLEEIESDLELLLTQREALLSYENMPVINGNRILLYQLFYNLINNALKFARRDVRPLIQLAGHLATHDELRHSSLDPRVRHCKIAVTDNGIGFQQEQADRIFSTFTRLHPKDRYEGTGLGLALCKKIVERHNGVIYAKSSEGQGATFVVLLPA